MVKRILRYLQGTKSHGLHLQKSLDFRLTSYSDFDRGLDPNDRKSASDFVYTLGLTSSHGLLESNMSLPGPI